MREEVMAMKEEINDLKQQSLAWEMLKDSKRANKRICISWAIVTVIISTFWFITMAYLIHILNDMNTTVETVTQENGNGYNNYIGNDGDIFNGKANNNKNH